MFQQHSGTGFWFRAETGHARTSQLGLWGVLRGEDIWLSSSDILKSHKLQISLFLFNDCSSGGHCLYVDCTNKTTVKMWLSRDNVLLLSPFKSCHLICFWFLLRRHSRLNPHNCYSYKPEKMKVHLVDSFLKAINMTIHSLVLGFQDLSSTIKDRALFYL